MRRSKYEPTGGPVFDELMAVAHFITSTTGYEVRFGCRCATLQSGTQRPLLAFVSFHTRDSLGESGPAFYERSWPFPTDRAKTLEGLMYQVLIEASNDFDHIA